MNEIDFLKSINNIDDDLLSAADRIPAKKPLSYQWVRFASIAAMVCAVIGLGIFTVRSLTQSTEPSVTVVSFALGDTYYDVAGVPDYVACGFLDADTLSRSTVDLKALTKDDLGEFMGTIRLSSKKELKVYHHIQYPTSDDICIVELSKGEYQIYVKREP